MIPNSLSLVSSFAVPLLLDGCAFMPQGGKCGDFLDPPPMDRALPKAGEGAARPGNAGPQDEWWRQFGSPELDRIMKLASLHNPNLKESCARVGEVDSLA
jgi:outer membrane protein TolC